MTIEEINQEFGSAVTEGLLRGSSLVDFSSALEWAQWCRDVAMAVSDDPLARYTLEELKAQISQR